jgi:hypothetical protein
MITATAHYVGIIILILYLKTNLRVIGILGPSNILCRDLYNKTKKGNTGKYAK